MPNIITYDQLMTAGACNDQLVLFKRMFGDSVDLSIIEYDHDKHGSFEFEWAAVELLEDKEFDRYYDITNKAYTECKDIEDKLWQDYIYNQKKVRDVNISKG